MAVLLNDRVMCLALTIEDIDAVSIENQIASQVGRAGPNVLGTIYAGKGRVILHETCVVAST